MVQTALAGNRAFYIFLNGSLGNVTSNEYLVGTSLDDTLYTISYSTKQPRFYYMSDVQHMIDSFQIDRGRGVSVNTTHENSNFSTYQNSTSGIKIDYPSPWQVIPSN